MKIKVKIVGVHDLLLANNQMADPLNKWKLLKEKITNKGKRKMTPTDYEELAKLDFQGHMYYKEDIGPVIFAEMIEANIREGSKTIKRGSGKEIERGVVVEEYFVPIIYDGPRDMLELYNYEDGRHRDIRLARPPGAKAGATISVCRPRFPKWSIEFTLIISEEILNPKDVILALESGGKNHGLGAYRPKYGRFMIQEYKEIKDVK
jgi:hypothetical protein